MIDYAKTAIFFITKTVFNKKRLVFILLVFLSIGCAKEEIKIISHKTVQDKNMPPDIQREIKPDTPAFEPAIARENPRSNPFLTLEEERALKTGITYIPIGIDRLNLSAVIYSPPRNSRVVINGRILELGNQIDGKEISDIKAEEVILKDSQNEYVLRLKNTLK